MDVSQVTNFRSVSVPPVKASKVADTVETLPSGNSLPEVEPHNIHSNQPQQKNSDSLDEGKPLQGLVDQTNKTLSMRFSNLKFTVAEGSDVPVVRIEDSETGELIRQIPSEQMVALAKAMEEIKQGMLLEEQA